ncbi:MAG: 23S rRNA (uracil(1939)-C(5))-methyltransferase RlmD [Gammaproteobacteria bacterium]|nr:23S rRNA (uracil(1939)-C(5))-methyltransferase RlmD [Gammaproteobacteria bacterium]
MSSPETTPHPTPPRKGRGKARAAPEPVEAWIEGLTHEGRGIARIEGKAVFVDGALAGEQVRFQYTRRKSQFDEAKTLEVLEASPLRVAPECPHFGVCGGCSLQHMDSLAQIAHKQAVLLELLLHFGQVQPLEVLPPLQAETYGYRRKARLGVKYVAKKGSVLVGFREKASHFITDIASCAVLEPSVSRLILPLRELITAMDARESIPQIEVAVGDKHTALVFRHLQELSEGDLAKLLGFAQEHKLELYLQPKGPDSVHKLWPNNGNERLSYRFDAFDAELLFHPMDFTQVNAGINKRMLPLAVDLLDPQEDERVLDLFCGLGNFTLPLARRAGHVIGVEGDEAMVVRGRENARHNGIGNIEFYGANLAGDFYNEAWARQGFDKILVDPPRTGALEIIKHFPHFNARRIVYVSCNPATLARAAGELARQGYVLTKAGVMDMFPHTAHVESIAVFEREAAGE